MLGFFVLRDADLREAARVTAILKSLPLKASKTLENPDARQWLNRGDGWPEIISIVADHNPAEIKRIRQACTYTEVAHAYNSRRAREYGVGWKYQGD